MYIIKILTTFTWLALLVHSLFTRWYNDWVKYQKLQYICFTNNYDWYFNNNIDWKKYTYSSWDLQCINANWEFYINKQTD